MSALAPVVWAEDPPIPADAEPIHETASGLRYSVLKKGDGKTRPKDGDRVKVHYSGWLTSGKLFDSSRKRGRVSEFGVNAVIDGWTEALKLMSKGAQFKLTIPGNIAYGAGGNPDAGIPPNQTLVFEVELVDVLTMPVFKKGDPAKQKTTESGVKWEVIRAGDGKTAPPGNVVTLNFAYWSANGLLVDCTERSGSTIRGKADEMRFEFLKEFLYKLDVGARWRLEVPPEVCFGQRAVGPLLPNSTTVWELELVKHLAPLPLPKFRRLDENKKKKTATGLQYEIIREGEGDAPRMGQRVSVHFAGWLDGDGRVFDSSYGGGEPSEFRLGMVISGWNEGVPLIKPGGAILLRVPPPLAYGSRGQGPAIPPNATLIFHIELLEVLE